MSWLADALVAAALVVMTVGVYGMYRLPDVHTQLHAASKTVVLGIVALLVASWGTGEAEIVLRALLIAVFVLLTTPVAAHAIARAAYRRGERMQAPESLDETRHLPGGDMSGV